MVQPPQFMRQEGLGQGPGVQEQRPLTFSPRMELCPWEVGPSWHERKVESEHPPEGLKAGQMLGKSQLMRKEAFNSPYFLSCLLFLFFE